MEYFRYTSKEIIFFFESFGIEGFKQFIIQNNKKMINKIFYDLKKFNAKDQKITIVTLKFSMKKFEKIKKSQKLSNIAIDVMHLTNSFGKNIM